MTPKTINYVYQERQDNFSCKHENTLKSTEFSEGDEQLCLLTVARFVSDLVGTQIVGFLFSRTGSYCVLPTQGACTYTSHLVGKPSM